MRAEGAQKKAEELAAEIAKAQVSNVADQIKDANGVPVLVQKVNADSVDALRNLGDQMRDKVGGVVVLAAVMGEKVSILTMATKDAVAKGVHAGNIVKAVAKLCGGGGGGHHKPDPKPTPDPDPKPPVDIPDQPTPLDPLKPTENIPDGKVPTTKP